MHDGSNNLTIQVDLRRGADGRLGLGDTRLERGAPAPPEDGRFVRTVAPPVEALQAGLAHQPSNPPVVDRQTGHLQNPTGHRDIDVVGQFVGQRVDYVGRTFSRAA